MNGFETYTPDNAPQASQELLRKAEKGIGFVPNLLGSMAVAPTLLEGYLSLGRAFSKSSFSATEQQIVLLTISRFNGCEYCMAAHSTIASAQNVPEDVIEALRNDRPILDSRLEALREFTTTMVDQRGWLEATTIQAFLDSGFNRQQVGEVILGVGMKTLSNYFNHVAETELDEFFQPMAWSMPTE
jgi:AhpD family alkylhydroperoxidase